MKKRVISNKSKTPLIIKIITSIIFFISILGLIGGFATLINTNSINSMIIGLFLGFVWFLIFIILGISFLKRKNLARWIIIMIIFFFLIGNIISNIILEIIYIIIMIYLIYYLIFNKQIKEYFKKR